jgi:hypothetical protein
MATQKTNYGTPQICAVTALQSLANSATAGWKSELIDNRTTLAIDYNIFIKLTTANTAPANDKAAHVFICPMFTDGTNLTYEDGGTATLPTVGDAAYTIANPNNLHWIGDMQYTTQQMVMQKMFSLLYDGGFSSVPAGFIIIIVNYTGAALSTACIVDVTPVFNTIV